VTRCAPADPCAAPPRGQHLPRAGRAPTPPSSPEATRSPSRRRCPAPRATHPEGPEAGTRAHPARHAARAPCARVPHAPARAPSPGQASAMRQPPHRGSPPHLRRAALPTRRGCARAAMLQRQDPARAEPRTHRAGCARSQAAADMRSGTPQAPTRAGRAGRAAHRHPQATRPAHQAQEPGCAPSP